MIDTQHSNEFNKTCGRLITVTEEEFAKIAKEVYGYSDDFIADTLNRHRECIEAGLIPPPLEDELWYSPEA